MENECVEPLNKNSEKNWHSGLPAQSSFTVAKKSHHQNQTDTNEGSLESLLTSCPMDLKT